MKKSSKNNSQLNYTQLNFIKDPNLIKEEKDNEYIITSSTEHLVCELLNIDKLNSSLPLYFQISSSGGKKGKILLELLSRGISKYDKNTSLKTSDDIFTYMQHIGYSHTEAMYAILLTCKLQVLGVHCIGKGGVSSCVVDPQDLLDICISNSITTFALVHCHPSGNPTPSSEDIRLTKFIISLFGFHDINCLDHIIIGNREYHSIRQEDIREEWDELVVSIKKYILYGD